MRSIRLAMTALTVLILAGGVLAQEGPAPAPRPPAEPGGPAMGPAPGGSPPAGQRGGPGQREMGPPAGGHREMGPAQGGPGGMMGPSEGAPRELSADEEERVLSFLKDFDPGRLAELQSLRERERPAYLRQLREAQRTMREFEELKSRDPARAELMKTEARLRGEIFALVKHAKETLGRAGAVPEGGAGPAPQAVSRAEVRAKLSEAVSKLFDVKIEMRKHEIERLREELKKHEAALTKAQEQKKDLVQRRIDLLLGDQEDVFDW